MIDKKIHMYIFFQVYIYEKHIVPISSCFIKFLYQISSCISTKNLSRIKHDKSLFFVSFRLLRHQHLMSPCCMLCLEDIANNRREAIHLLHVYL